MSWLGELLKLEYIGLGAYMLRRSPRRDRDFLGLVSGI